MVETGREYRFIFREVAREQSSGKQTLADDQEQAGNVSCKCDRLSAGGIQERVDLSHRVPRNQDLDWLIHRHFSIYRLDEREAVPVGCNHPADITRDVNQASSQCVSGLLL